MAKRAKYNADSQVIERTTAIQDGTLSGPDNGTWSYSYDPMGRLRTATDPDGVFFEYAYDGAGNRTLVKETHSDNDVERVTSAITDYEGAQPTKSTTTVTVEGVTTPPVETTYSHDDRGNLTRIDGPGAWRSFSYDHWGRLRTAQDGAPDEAAVAKQVYSYDGLERTLVKASSTVTAGTETAVARELYWHSGLGHELVQTSHRGPDGATADSVVTSYAYREGVPYAVLRSGPTTAPTEGLPSGVLLDSGGVDVQTTLLGTNPHGDVVYAMTRDHVLQSITSYDPWGAVRSQVRDDGMLGFQADPTDRDTGLVDMEARNYLPELGRLISQDTYGGELNSPLTQNHYVYGLDDPVSMVDPTGHMANKASGGGDCYCVTPYETPQVGPTRPRPGDYSRSEFALDYIHEEMVTNARADFIRASMFRRRALDSDRLVANVLGYGDIDASVAPGAERIALLNTDEKKTLESVEVQSAAALKDAMERLGRATRRRQTRIGRRKPRLEIRTDRRAHMTLWIKKGVLERLTIFDAPLPVRWGLLVVLAFLDYYIFGKSVAVALDIEDSLGNVQFWLAGVLGLAVFVVGVFLGFVLKRYALAVAQASLVAEQEGLSKRVGSAGGDGTDLPPRTSSGFALVVFTALMFLTLCVVGAFIRLEAGTSERQSAVILQMLVPVVVVLVEYFTHDPTHVRVPRRSPVDWWLDHRVSQAKARVEQIKTTSDETKKRIRQVFVAARQKLRVALLDLRFNLEGEGPGPNY